ncbi:ABC transporter transmembrane domain-containing protein [Rugosimonospora africana]|uniref:ABC transporter transmembrane domain-containing protein n=1 Tax=Rugosimonospora africana TaxID=556532 RepID=UPI00194224A0|nr:ABC transporter ATP-binding protein [Rugosimonospora africana]
MLAGAFLGTTWMIGLIVPPWLLSKAVDEGLIPGDLGRLVEWVAALIGVGVLTAYLSIMRHRTMTRIRMDGAFRTVTAVNRHATVLGATLSRRVTSGEVVTIGIGDVGAVAMALTMAGPGFGGLVAYAVVVVLVFAISPLLAIIVLAGVPVLAGVVGPLLKRLNHTGTAYRQRQGVATARIVDIVGGLRVLSGLGGKDVFARRYRADSAALRVEGYRVGAVSSWIAACGVGLPALFLAVVTWIAARMAAQGTIRPGDLVAVYGYVGLLVIPVFQFIEAGESLSRALVAASRIVRFLNLAPDRSTGTGAAPPRPSELHEPRSGVRIAAGEFVALVGARPAEAEAVIERLGGFAPSDATWGGVRLDAIDADELRRRIVVADNDAYLFAGAFREVVGGADDASVLAAVDAAAVRDVVEALPDGLNTRIRGRAANLSGGQRQRVRLVRALLADPEILLAAEPTSAVDAHTEAAMVDGLRRARSGRTTVVTTTSPLVLDRADRVMFLVDGVVVATGTHAELLTGESGYRAVVARTAGEAAEVRR